MRPVYIIVAVAENGVIGRDGRLPWNLPEDWQYFLDVTRHGVLVMGRRCWAEFGRDNARDRDVIVLTRAHAAAVVGARTAPSLSEALGLAQSLAGNEPIWICGGESVYREALPLAQRLYLTQVHAAPEGDTFFRGWEARFTRCLGRCEGRNEGQWRCTFSVWEAP